MPSHGPVQRNQTTRFRLWDGSPTTRPLSSATRTAFSCHGDNPAVRTGGLARVASRTIPNLHTNIDTTNADVRTGGEKVAGVPAPLLFPMEITGVMHLKKASDSGRPHLLTRMWRHDACLPMDGYRTRGLRSGDRDDAASTKACPPPATSATRTGKEFLHRAANAAACKLRPAKPCESIRPPRMATGDCSLCHNRQGLRSAHCPRPSRASEKLGVQIFMPRRRERHTRRPPLAAEIESCTRGSPVSAALSWRQRDGVNWANN